jgi:pyruvate kinase
VRRAKIVCTLGPATAERDRIGALIDAGMDTARLNMSHGRHEDHARTAAFVREEAEQRGRPVAILCDLQGPKIRVGTFTGGSAELVPGADFVITTRDVEGCAHWVSTDLKELPHDVKPGDTVLLNDGLIRVEVWDVVGEDVHTRVTTGGTLKDHKGLALPGIKVSTPSLTDKDREDLRFALGIGVDFVALSFVRTAEEVLRLRDLVTQGGDRVPIIAKIESTEGVENLARIIDVAEGIMVARGDLGIELGPEKVPLVQKHAIEEANRRGKLVITATEMLESMISQPRPTRAEASDVANAVLDGTDALMLSAETAAGRYPVEAVRAMASIIAEIERSERYLARVEPTSLSLHVSTDAIAHAAVLAAREIQAVAIACLTQGGTTARLMSEYRPTVPIVALATREPTYRRLALEWGVVPRRITLRDSLDAMIIAAAEECRAAGLAKGGDWIVITMAMPPDPGAPSNVLRLHRL